MKKQYIKLGLSLLCALVIQLAQGLTAYLDNSAIISTHGIAGALAGGIAVFIGTDLVKALKEIGGNDDNQSTTEGPDQG